MKYNFKASFYTGLAIALLFISSSCTATRIPKEPLPDAEISFSRDGGMRYWNESLTISSSKCRYTENNEGKETEVNCKVTPEDFLRLYSALRDNNFDLIKLSSGTVYDKAGEHISIRYGKESFNLGTSGGEVEKRWMKNWDNIVSAFDTFLKTVK